MIHPKRLLDDLKRFLRRLEDDLRERPARWRSCTRPCSVSTRRPGRPVALVRAFEVWREGMLTQAAVAWLLGCVFVRFLEDNGLVEEALLSGPQERRRQAADRQMQYFQQRPTG